MQRPREALYRAYPRNVGHNAKELTRICAADVGWKSEVPPMETELNIQVIPLTAVPMQNRTETGGNRVVLVVDDERLIADTLSVILTRSGFRVMTAYDAESALELADGVMPDLLISDVMMGPGMDGTQLAIRVAEQIPHCKILLFSGHAGTMDLLAKARAIGHSFLLMSKPVHPSDLLARIREFFPTISQMQS